MAAVMPATAALAPLAEPPAGQMPAHAALPTQAGLSMHGTAVRWLGRGVLLLGASGAGKSDLALRLIEAGGVLVADDLVQLAAHGTRLVASPTAAGLGLIELRGQGIFKLPALRSCALDCCVTLAAAEGGPAERLPAPAKLVLAGIALPHYRLDPLAPSITARLRVLLTAERAH